MVLVLLDDVGFGASSPFGGPVETPAVEELARVGLRFNRFHTTAICSPTRASLLTGRDAHVTGVGTVLNLANSHNGYEGVLRDSTATIATVLQQRGYSTACFGKWHLAPGLAKGADIMLALDGGVLGTGRVSATPPGFFSIDETFNIGMTAGSPVGDHPHSYPFDGALERVDVFLR